MNDVPDPFSFLAVPSIEEQASETLRVLKLDPARMPALHAFLSGALAYPVPDMPPVPRKSWDNMADRALVAFTRAASLAMEYGGRRYHPKEIGEAFLCAIARPSLPAFGDSAANRMMADGAPHRDTVSAADEIFQAFMRADGRAELTPTTVNTLWPEARLLLELHAVTTSLKALEHARAENLTYANAEDAWFHYHRTTRYKHVMSARGTALSLVYRHIVHDMTGLFLPPAPLAQEWRAQQNALRRIDAMQGAGSSSSSMDQRQQQQQAQTRPHMGGANIVPFKSRRGQGNPGRNGPAGGPAV